MIIKTLAKDSEPHYTTISNFISGMSNEIEKVFRHLYISFFPHLDYNLQRRKYFLLIKPI